MKRRAFLSGLFSTPIAMTAPRALAELKLGSATISTVSDGSLILPGTFLFGDLPMSEVAPILSQYAVSPEELTPECNLALYRSSDRRVLFDVGSGPDFMPRAGKIVASLDLLGLAPEDITDVLFTHAHPDHIWGLLDDFDDPLFFNATYHMGRAEWAYWWNPETVNTIGEMRAAFAVGAKRRMEMIEDRVVLFDDGDEVLPGIEAVSTAGHTPGHMSFVAGDGTERVMILGDAISNHHLAFAHPEWPSGADHDPVAGAATRETLFDRILADQLQVIGFHLPNGGIGRVGRDGDGFRFLQGG